MVQTSTFDENLEASREVARSNLGTVGLMAETLKLSATTNAERFEAYSAIGTWLMSNRRYQQALEPLTWAVNYIEDPNAGAWVFRDLAIAYEALDMTSLALVHAQAALKLLRGITGDHAHYLSEDLRRLERHLKWQIANPNPSIWARIGHWLDQAPPSPYSVMGFPVGGGFSAW